MTVFLNLSSGSSQTAYFSTKAFKTQFWMKIIIIIIIIIMGLFAEVIQCQLQQKPVAQQPIEGQRLLTDYYPHVNCSAERGEGQF